MATSLRFLSVFRLPLLHSQCPSLRSLLHARLAAPRTSRLFPNGGNCEKLHSGIMHRQCIRDVTLNVIKFSSSRVINTPKSRLFQVRDVMPSSHKSSLPVARGLIGRLGGAKEVLWERGFHTTARKEVHPLLLLLIKPAAKLASVITGRSFRQWWKRRTPEERAKLRGRLGEWRPLFALGLGVAALFALFHYRTHIEETPVTHRRRYVSLTADQFQKIALYEYEVQYEAVKEKIVPTTHPVYKRITGIISRIVNSNQDLAFMSRQTWTIIVVDDPQQNAFVLPTGHIFVFTGLLKIAESDQQLAVVLGHEIAHALLSHAAEQVSFAAALDVVIIVVLAAIWAVMPTDGLAIFTQWFYDRVMQIMLHLPYSRKLEQEADEVGLQLIAKACYDVRESSVFWSAMALRAQIDDQLVVPEFLSTHPNNDSRAETLDTLIPAALALRESCNCPKLSAQDPRDSLAYLRRQLSEKQVTVAPPSR